MQPFNQKSPNFVFSWKQKNHISELLISRLKIDLEGLFFLIVQRRRGPTFEFR